MISKQSTRFTIGSDGIIIGNSQYIPEITIIYFFLFYELLKNLGRMIPDKNNHKCQLKIGTKLDGNVLLFLLVIVL